VRRKIFLTGGSGYIGTHTCVEILAEGYDIVIYDNLSNSTKKALNKVEKIANKKITFIEGDIRDEKKLYRAMLGCDAVIHFAGLKAVGESVAKPLEYYDNNVSGTISLLKSMKKAKIKTIVFSSSATVYGNPEYLPIDERHPLRTMNPYGTTKLMIENILQDIYKSDSSWKIIILRYFNPVGAHKTGLIGENPNGIPNNLMPLIAQTALGKREYLQIFGQNWETNDGTGVRDYIHVVDLALAHLKALSFLKKPCFEVINIGTGKGHSVLEIIKAFEKNSGRKIPYKFMPRRSGDIAECYADVSKAKQLLNWEAVYSLDDMCKSTWKWQNMNPNGYI